MRTWIWISLLAVVVVLGAGLLSATPIAKRMALSKAKERGLVLEMEDFSLGWMEAHLRDVTIKLEGVSAIQIDVDKMEVELGWGAPRVRRVVVRGGLVQIDGTVETVKKSIEEWRARRPVVEETEESTGVRREDVVRDLEVIWTNALGQGSKQTVSGLQIERTGEAQKFGADHVEIRLGNLSAEIAGGLAQFPPGGLDLAQAQNLSAAEVRVIYSATEENPPAKSASSNPPRDTASDDSDASGLEERLEKDVQRVQKLSAALTLLRSQILPRLPSEARVERLWVTYLKNDEKLHIGPSLLLAKKEKNGAFKTTVEPQGDTKGTPLSLETVLHPKGAGDAVTVSMKGGPVSFRTLGITEGSFGLEGVNQTTVSGNMTAHLRNDAKVLSGGGTIAIEGLSIDSPRLAKNLVTFPRLTLSGQGQMAVDGSRYELSQAELALGETRFEGSLKFESGKDYVTLKASAKAPLVSCQALLDSAPRGLLGAVELMRFDGTFSLETSVEADTRKLRDMNVRWDFKNGCRVKAVPGPLDPDQFRGAFRREVIGAGNFPIQLEFGPLSNNWVPWEEVSPYMEKALLVTEDGRFYSHDGLDDRAIESAIRDNVRAGTFVRGASTISMQLAKNLYLSRSKTLSRKLQEVSLTLLLEQSFEKRELLELYVNVVEFGPGIYGIRQAAEHYFDSHPGRLTAAQAFFLASILPAPTREHFAPDGTLQKTQLAYVHRLLGISAKREALTEAELEEALAEELVLGQPSTKPRKQEEEEDEEEEDETQQTGPPPALHPRKPNQTDSTLRRGSTPIFPKKAPAPKEAP